MKEFTSLPVTPATKQQVTDVKYRMHVDTFDEAVNQLVRAYQNQNEESTPGE